MAKKTATAADKVTEMLTQTETAPSAAPPPVLPKTLKVKGSQLKASIKQWIKLREQFSAEFKDSIYTFKDDQKRHPDVIMKDFIRAERAVCRLQDAQQQFNKSAAGTLRNGQTMDLSIATKIIGGLGRAEKMWNTASHDAREDR